MGIFVWSEIRGEGRGQARTRVYFLFQGYLLCQTLLLLLCCGERWGNSAVAAALSGTFFFFVIVIDHSRCKRLVTAGEIALVAVVLVVGKAKVLRVSLVGHTGIPGIIYSGCTQV